MKYRSNKIKIILTLILLVLFVIPINAKADIVNVGDSQTFNYTGEVQEFIVPKTGIYKLETWGAQGGGSDTDKNYGGYSTGLIELEKNQKLYIVVGGIPNGYTGGYNGGGSAGSSGSAGGGATHISTSTGLLRTLSNDKDSVLIVSGGGGGSDGGSGGGAGGGLKGTRGGDYGSQYPGGSGGTQTGAGTGGGFGYGSSAASEDGDYGSAGGGGYYGGGRSAARAGSGGGGSGYIGNELLTNKKMVMYSTDSSFISNEESTKTEITENVSETPTADYTKIGNGAAKITYVENTNNYLSNLEVEENTLDYTFDRHTTTYNVYILKSETSIHINAQADDELATVAGDGEIDVSSKPSSVNITVTAENGEIRVYTINIYYDTKNQPNVFNYTGNEQVFIAPKTGIYKLETWGAQGGNSSYNSYEATGGYGGYSEGIIELEKGDVLYINVGGKGQSVYYNTSSTPTTDDGIGYNGGGYGSYYSNNSSHGAGGGATHIATSSGLLSTFKDITSNVLMVAGGGGGASTHTSYPSYSGTGGSGGGIKGSSGITVNSTCYNYGTGGSQTSIGSYTTCSSDGRGNESPIPPAATFGKGQSYSSFSTTGVYSGGGAGFYGGGSGYHGPGAGGSGYIGNELLTDKKMVMYSTDSSYISNDESTKTEITENVSETPTEDYAKSGNGAARVTYVENTNNYLSNLEVEGYILDNTFDKHTTTYNIYVLENETSIQVNAQADDELATVIGDGEIDISSKPSSVNITVTAEDGDIRVYTININYVINDQPNVFNYTGNEQKFIVPKTGIYKLETWGASGNTPTASNVTLGYGGYSIGYAYLQKGEIIYINVGGQGSDGIATSSEGGYNGGGAGKYYPDGRGTGSGGGATHMATSTGLLSSLENNKNSILIVSGGGGGVGNFTGKYSQAMVAGSGGGIKGSNGDAGYDSIRWIGYGGTQTAGGAITPNETYGGTSGSFGTGGSCATSKEGNCSGGGAGYYGGGSNTNYGGAGGGGSGYIGSTRLISNDDTTKHMSCYNCTTSDDESTKTISNTCSNETATEDCSKEGNGAAKITLIPSANNYLSSLEVDGYELSEPFDKEKEEYTITIPSNIDSVNISATVEDSKASLTGDGLVSITDGMSDITLKVTAENGDIRSYVINLNIISTNNNLSNLEVEGFVLNENFDSNKTKYTLTVPLTTDSVNVIATPEDRNSTLTGDGEINLIENTTDINVVVTSQYGENRTYTIKISKDKIVCRRAIDLHSEICKGSDDCLQGRYKENDNVYYGNLGSRVDGIRTEDAFTCDVNGDGSFDEETERFYYVSDYFDTETLEFNHDYATLIFFTNVIIPNSSWNKMAVSHANYGDPSGLAIYLPSVNRTGQYTFLRTKNDYESLIWNNVSLYKQTRNILYRDKTHYNIKYSTYTYPEYNTSRLLTYHEIEANCLNDEKLTCESLLEKTGFATNDFYNGLYKTDSASAYWLETLYYNSSRPQKPYIYTVGKSSLRSFSAKGQDSSGYAVRPVIEVKKTQIDLMSNNYYLKNLSVENHTLNEDFSKYNDSYTLAVPDTVDSVNVINETEDKLATSSFKGVVELDTDPKIVPITVTAESGLTKVYNLTIDTLSTNADLKSLSIDNHTLNEEFDKDNLEYTVNLDDYSGGVNINAVAEDATATISGNNYNKLQDDGVTVIKVTVTAEAGNTKEYTIRVTNGKSICKRATYLNEIKFGQSGPSSYPDITAKYYGNIGNGNSLSIGDAFICDVNSDGTYDEETERFYYMGDYFDTNTLEFNPNYSILIYNSPLKNTKYGSTTEYDINYTNLYDSTSIDAHRIYYYGPTEAATILKPASEWTGVKLYKDHRRILNENSEAKTGEYETETFDYSNYSSRLLTYQELVHNLNLTSPGTQYELSDYPFLFENRYKDIIDTDTIMHLETVYSEDSSKSKQVRGSSRKIETSNLASGIVKPVIEVKTSSINLESTNNYLTSLGVRNTNLLETFDKEKLEYTVRAISGTKSLTIDAVPEDENSTVRIVGNTTLSNENNVIDVIVTSETGLERVYKITVLFTPNKNFFDNLEVEGYELSPSYSANVTTYNVAVDPGETSINIIATTDDEASKIEGDGIHELQAGDNTFNVSITSFSNSKRVYKINVTRSQPLCKRAINLHSEICDGGICESSGLSNGDTIVYGSLGSGNILKPGDAFTCDVNGDGIYDEETERFYYTSNYAETFKGNMEVDGVNYVNSYMNDKYGTFIYYKNITDSSDVDYNDQSINNVGPTVASTYLPTKSSWNNINLYNTNRVIVTDKYSDENGTVTEAGDTEAFDYSNYGSRLLTSMESLDVGEKIGTNTFYLENTKYSNSSNVTDGYWLENPVKENSTSALSLSASSLGVKTSLVTGDEEVIGVRPAIEVKKNQLDLTSNNNLLKDLKIDGYTLNEVFNKYNQNYTVSLPVGIENINVTATPEDESSVVVGAGKSETPVGESTINVLVTSVSGEVRTYTITVTREADTNLNISEINVTGGSLIEQFDNSLNEYTIKPDAGETSITIEVIPESEYATVSGNNVIVLDNNETETTITVTAEDGSTREVKFTILSYDSIEVDEEDITMVVGDTKVIEITNDVPEEEVDIVSSDSNIASVSGLIITGISKGESTITLSLKSDNTITKTITVTVLSDKLESNIYVVEDKVRPKENEEDPEITDRIVTGMEVGVTISEFKDNMLNPNEHIKIYDVEGNIVEETDIVKTGQVIKLEYNGQVYDEAIMILKGDINGDGLIDVSDRAEVKNHILEITLLEGYKIYASDIIEDGIIDVSDNSKITDYVLGIIDSLNN